MTASVCVCICYFLRFVKRHAGRKDRQDRTKGRQEKQLQSAFASNYCNPQQQQQLLQELVGAPRTDTRTDRQTDNICSCQRLQNNYNKNLYKLGNRKKRFTCSE